MVILRCAVGVCGFSFALDANGTRVGACMSVIHDNEVRTARVCEGVNSYRQSGSYAAVSMEP